MSRTHTHARTHNSQAFPGEDSEECGKPIRGVTALSSTTLPCFVRRDYNI